MLKNYLKIAFRNLRKNKTFSLINIIGFAFGISICLGITAYLLHEHSFDQYHANSNRIYRLVDAKENYSSIDYRVKDILSVNYPEIEKACLSLLITRPTPVAIHNKGAYVDNLMSADNAFFDMFSVPVLRGDKNKPLSDLYSVVLTESAAKKLFGTEDPLGQEIDFRQKAYSPMSVVETNHPLTVTAIILDFPDNSSIQAQMIVNAENDNFKFAFSCERGDDNSTYRWLFNIYLLMHKDVDKSALTAKINANAESLKPYEDKISLIALPDLYLHDNTRGSETKRGNFGLLKLLLSIGLTILILAVINYVNLTAAQQNKRYREIGIKKSIGAKKSDIIIQFLIESIIVSFLSFLIAIVFLLQSIPIYRSIFYDTFNIYQLINYWYLILPSVIILGIVSGFASAFLFSSLHPIRALRGEIFTTRNRFSWRSGLTVFQFIVSIALIFCIIIMQEQIRYVKNTNPGFDKEQLLKLDMPQIQLADKNKALLLVDKFRQYPGIKSTSMTNGIPGRIYAQMGANMPGKNKSIHIIYADSSFIKTFGFDIIKGRSPMPGDYGTTCLINEAAYHYFGWTDLENKKYNNGRPGGFDVVGVVNDFHYNSFHSAIEPMCILFPNGVYPTHLNIKIAGGQISETMRLIRKTWEEILPQYPLQYEFYDTWLDAMYREDEKIGTAIGLFGVLAIVISCLGILGMAIFSTQKRTKEIGIRKVVGATVPEIITMLFKDFTKWIILANIIAWPVGWYAMNKWLQDFAYRIDLTIWPFLLAGLLALLIALFTVSWQAIRAATANPVESLRNE